ncbi:hypothetical protein JCM10450v2_004662 [Rhodotorula kratochvilovae]
MASPFALPGKSSLSILPALSLFLSPATSTRAASRPSPASAFFAREPAPSPPSSTARSHPSSARDLERRHHDVHHAPAPARGASEMELRLSTTCTACGEPVAVEVPRWIIAAMEGAQHVSGAMHREERVRGHGARGDSAAEWREWVVQGVVNTARAVKASPIPGMILSCVQTLFAVLLYLDERFSIHQRIALMLGAFFEGLVEIEKEVGIMRSAGEALSIGWEATVKGVIAFAKAGAADTAGPQDATNMSRTSSHTPRASSPVAPQSYNPDMLGMHFTPHSPPYLASYEVPESEYPYYDSTSTSRAPSPVLTHPRALHRGFVSSPSLQSAYLSTLSPTSSPKPDHSMHRSPSSPPTEALLAPYDPAVYSAAHHAHARPRIVRQRSATGPDPDARDAALALPAPPPSPSSAMRGGWAGKAVIGLAERMKVL